jgi:hypothetical protein
MEETASSAGSAGDKSLDGKSWVYILAAVVVIALGVAAYFWYQASSIKENPQEAIQEQAQKEAQELIALVSQLIVLPDDEEPVIATVADPSKLADQPFFSKAQEGDKVLIYNTSKKAILYNPSEHRIVDVAPLNIGN